jgi:hypothetical protein
MYAIFRNLVILLLLLNGYRISAQTETDSVGHMEFNRYSIYTTAGFYPIYAILNGNFEVKIASNSRVIAHYIGGKASVGYWESMIATGQQIGLGITTLSGKKANHLEVYAGITSIFDTDQYRRHLDYPDNFPNQQPVYFKNYVFIWPSISLGYRYQKPQKPFLFRTGLGYPDAVYVSLGYSFN